MHSLHQEFHHGLVVIPSGLCQQFYRHQLPVQLSRLITTSKMIPRRLVLLVLQHDAPQTSNPTSPELAFPDEFSL